MSHLLCKIESKLTFDLGRESFEDPDSMSLGCHKPKMRQRRKENSLSVLKRNAKEYCNSTSLHGFAYWVQARNNLERFGWIVFTITSLVFAGVIISSAVRDWEENPGVTGIASFNKVDSKVCYGILRFTISYHLQPLTDINFPSLTFCNEYGVDTGEYVRNVFNNLQWER